MQGMGRRWSRGPTIQAALVLAFGATVLVWIVAGIQFARRVSDAQREAANLSARYVTAQDQLSQVRTQALLGSMLIRDALLDPDAQPYGLNFEQACAVATNALDTYVPVLGEPAEHQRIQELRRELASFRSASLDVLASDRRQWVSQAHRLLNLQIAPRLDSVLQISDEILARNRAAFVRQLIGLGDIYETTQQRIWQQLGVVLGVSLIIALAATIYVGRLEKEVQHRQRREQRHVHDLQRLSAKLLTVQEEERRTIARELHDEVGQMLMALKVELSVARRAAAASNAATSAFDDAQRMSDAALSAIRDLSRLLHPALLDDLGLQAAIEWYLGSVSRRHQIRTESSFEGLEDRFAPEIEAAFFRIVQEAVTNVVKHARATTCRVHLRRDSGNLVLTVEDDGAGFETSRPQVESEPRGLGLIGIRERVLQVGGGVTVQSTPGHGTRIVAVVPARPRVDAPEREEMTLVSEGIAIASESARG